MADEVTSDEVRTRQFDVVRKGYDRNQVESFLAVVAGHIDTSEAQLAEMSDVQISVGLDDPEALAKELKTIGGEVGAILEAARSAAEGMRLRSAEDVETWRAQAETDIEGATSTAAEQSQALRDAAWVEGSALLEAAIAEAALVIEETQRDSLRIRAEAEREAIRYSGDAKRTSDETIGAAESEAEAIIALARSEGESIVAVANQSAEVAQERVRVLEDQHVELLAVLETARSSIGDIDTEIESRKHELDEPPPFTADETRMHHAQDGGSVRIVSGSTVVPLKPVDADSFVAEVAALHQAEEVARTSQVPPVSVVADLPPVEPSLDSVPTSADTKVEANGALDSDRDKHESPADPPAPPKVDQIGSLFAKLRENDQGRVGVSLETEETSGSPHDRSESPGDGTERSDGGHDIGVDVRDEDQAGLFSTTEEVPPVDSLIPVQNKALRSIKRLLVDLQNDTLEHLRTDNNWIPQEDYTDRFGDAFAKLASAITGDRDDSGAASVFATDLYDPVSTAVVSSRAAGSGDRAVAAATSKVFRTWRSDEAERRVVAVATDLAATTVDI